MASNNIRHSLENLKIMADWLNANDVSTHSLGAWEALHKKVTELNESSYLDITNIKSTAKGTRLVKAIPKGYNKHPRFNIIYTTDVSMELYVSGTGISA